MSIVASILDGVQNRNDKNENEFTFHRKMNVINTYYLCVGRQHCPPLGVPHREPHDACGSLKRCCVIVELRLRNERILRSDGGGCPYESK